MSGKREAERRKTRLGREDRSVTCGAPQIRGHGNVFRRSVAGFVAEGPCFLIAAEREALSDASANQWRAPVVEPDSHPQPPERAGYVVPAPAGTASRPAPSSVPDNAPLNEDGMKGL